MLFSVCRANDCNPNMPKSCVCSEGGYFVELATMEDLMEFLSETPASENGTSPFGCDEGDGCPVVVFPRHHPDEPATIMIYDDYIE